MLRFCGHNHRNYGKERVTVAWTMNLVPLIEGFMNVYDCGAKEITKVWDYKKPILLETHNAT